MLKCLVFKDTKLSSTGQTFIIWILDKSGIEIPTELTLESDFQWRECCHLLAKDHQGWCKPNLLKTVPLNDGRARLWNPGDPFLLHPRMQREYCGLKVATKLVWASFMERGLEIFGQEWGGRLKMSSRRRTDRQTDRQEREREVLLHSIVWRSIKSHIFTLFTYVTHINPG